MDRDLLGADLVHQLSYLSAIAAAGIPRSEIFQLASRLPNPTSQYFAQIDNIAKSMNYQYAEACRVVAESVKEEEVRSLLLRLAGAMSSGEPEVEFLTREAGVQAEAYGNVYEQKLETLKKWTDAYAALVVSGVLIVVVATVSTLIYSLGMTVVLGLVFLTLLMTGMGAWIIWATAPREVKVLRGLQGRASQRLPLALVYTLGPAAAITAIAGFMAGIPMGFALIAGAALLAPIGFVSARHDSRLTRNENDFNTFLRMLGATASAIGTTPAEAIGRIDLRSAPSLTKAIRKLQIELASRAAPELCWQRFITERGSDLIAKTVRVFVDGIRLGGDPEEVGSRASILATKISFLRAKRRLVTSTFGYLSIAMHASTVFLLIFVVEIVSGFADLVQHAGLSDQTVGSAQAQVAATAAFSFSSANLALLQRLVGPIVIILSVINALAPKLADGRYIHTFFLYLSATLLASGVALVVAPVITGAIYSLAASF